MNKFNIDEFPNIDIHITKDDKRKYKKTLEKKFGMSVSEKLDMCRMGVRTVSRGYKYARLITGIPGIGKSFSVMSELRDEAENPDIENFVIEYVTGGIQTARAFYQFLSENNDKNKIIVFDDVNMILKDKECIEILRCACENEAIRTITFSDNVIAKDKKHKEKLKFHSKVIIITNIPIKKLDHAIVSRTNPINIQANINEIFHYVAENAKAAPPRKVSIHHKIDVLKFVKNDIGLENIQRFDFRIFEDISLWRASTENTKEWQSYVYSIVANI